MSFHPPFLATLLVGVLAGTHAATWGMYKDSAYEGFSTRKYLRSIALGCVAALMIPQLRPIEGRALGGLVVLFGLTYVVERVLVEWSKLFIRREDQSKYFIPMQFAIGGQVVRSPWLRLGAGVLYAGGIYLVVLLVDSMAGLTGRSWAAAVAMGGLGGLVCAIGGAWKDAPLEGFSFFKFLRSPGISAAWAGLMALLTRDPVALTFGALGYSIATIESYKKFAHPHKPPGKFDGKQLRFPEMLTWRRRFVPLYLGISGAVLATFAMALSGAVPALPELAAILVWQ